MWKVLIRTVILPATRLLARAMLKLAMRWAVRHVSELHLVEADDLIRQEMLWRRGQRCQFGSGELSAAGAANLGASGTCCGGACKAAKPSRVARRRPRTPRAIESMHPIEAECASPEFPWQNPQ